jgi:hypothetical protein
LFKKVDILDAFIKRNNILLDMSQGRLIRSASIDIEMEDVFKVNKKILTLNPNSNNINRNIPSSSQIPTTLNRIGNTGAQQVGLSAIFFAGQFDKFLNEFETLSSKDNFEITPKEMNMLTKIFLLKKCDLNTVEKIIHIIKQKRLQIGGNSQVDIFLSFINNNNVIGALENLNSLPSYEPLHVNNPSIYLNLLCIGLSLVNRLDIAMEKIEEIISLELDGNKYQGLVFPFTVNKKIKFILKLEIN